MEVVRIGHGNNRNEEHKSEPDELKDTLDSISIAL